MTRKVALQRVRGPVVLYPEAGFPPRVENSGRSRRVGPTFCNSYGPLTVCDRARHEASGCETMAVTVSSLMLKPTGSSTSAAMRV